MSEVQSTITTVFLGFRHFWRLYPLVVSRSESRVQFTLPTIVPNSQFRHPCGDRNTQITLKSASVGRGACREVSTTHLHFWGSPKRTFLTKIKKDRFLQMICVHSLKYVGREKSRSYIIIIYKIYQETHVYNLLFNFHTQSLCLNYWKVKLSNGK